MFKKYGPNERNSINKIVLILILQWYRNISFKLVYWGQMYRILAKKYIRFYILSIYSKSMTNYQKKFFSITVLYFFFYVRKPNFVEIDLLGKKLKMYDIFPSIFMAPTYVGIYFQVMPYFLLMSRSKRTWLPNLGLLSAM